MARTEALTNEKPVASSKMRKITVTICQTKADRDGITGSDLTDGRMIWREDLKAHQRYNATTALWEPASPQKNYLLNGAARVAQRGTGPFTADQNRVADQWVLNRIGTTISSSRILGALGTFPGVEEAAFYTSTVVTSVAGAGNLAALTWNIEDVGALAGKTICISFWAKANATKTISVEAYQGFGTGGSPSAFVSQPAGTKVLTTSWARQQVFVTLPSISGKTLGTDGNHNTCILIWFDAGSTFATRSSSIGQQSGTFDVGLMQVELGDCAGPFEWEPLATTYERCYRHFFRHGTGAYQQFGVGSGGSTTTMNFIVHLPVIMHRLPTLVVTSATDAEVYPGAVAATAVALSAQNHQLKPVVTVTVASGLTAGVIYAVQASASGLLDLSFSAELA